jgi:hypothetical protein
MAALLFLRESILFDMFHINTEEQKYRSKIFLEISNVMLQ